MNTSPLSGHDLQRFSPILGPSFPSLDGSFDTRQFGLLMKLNCQFCLSGSVPPTPGALGPPPRSRRIVPGLSSQSLTVGGLVGLLSNMMAQMCFHLQGGNIYRLPHPLKEENAAGGW